MIFFKCFFLFAFILLISSTITAGDCGYWNSLVDPKAPQPLPQEIKDAEKDTIAGIECLLKLQGRKSPGVRTGQKSFVSQIVPRATVEINALYQISELFYGDTNFAYAIALVATSPKSVDGVETLEFNTDRLVRAAFKSYRRWFKEIKNIGLENARAKKLDPLKGSGVEWYGPGERYEMPPDFQIGMALRPGTCFSVQGVDNEPGNRNKSLIKQAL